MKINKIELNLEYDNGIKELVIIPDEIKRLNDIINRIEKIYQSLCFSAPENDYIFIEQLGEVLQELKGDDK